MGEKIYLLGALTWVVGLILCIGNLTGLFPSFSYAGYLVTLVGFGIQSAGNAFIKNSM